jgi:aspartyl-tRNA(Asn)/glutamyl-tRNA(Gln) amidotransferase subunit A
MAELSKLSIKALAGGMREKKFSAEDIVKDCLAEIALKDGDLNSFVFVDEDGAFAEAKKVDKKLAAGEDLSLLAGIPAGIKDLINTKGVRTTCSSSFLKDFVPPYDATVIEKLKKENMVLLGKTNLDEFASGASTEHSAFGVTKNPYDLNCVAGGSSGGSAAAVAADLCTYSLGTDTGGSIRQPASFCGVYGLKPTYGRVSRSGVTSMASSWDTIGTMTKTVEDTAIVFQVMAGKDVRDLTTPDREVPDYSSFLDQDVKGMKLGLPKEYFGEGVDKEVADSVKAAAKQLESMGAEVIEVSLPSTKYAVAVYYITQPAELSANLERFDGLRYGKSPEGDYDDMVDFYFKTRGEGFGDEIKRRIMIGTYVLSAGYFDAYYKKAQKVRTVIINEFNKVFEKVDALIAPVAPTPAFKIGALVDDPLAMYMADVLTIPASAAGLPAMSCPCGLSSGGLPIGVQLIAPQFEEGTLLKLAHALERSAL